MTTGGRTPLTREAIVDAAQELLERRGLTAMSMRALGRQLGVEAMALYHWFDNKDALLDAIVERFADSVEVPRGDGPSSWAHVARSFARAFRAAAARHPATAQLLLVRPPPAQAVARSRSAIDELVRSGLDTERAVLAYRTLSAYTWGSLIEDRRSSPFSEMDRGTEFESGLEVILRGLDSLR